MVMGEDDLESDDAGNTYRDNPYIISNNQQKFLQNKR